MKRRTMLAGAAGMTATAAVALPGRAVAATDPAARRVLLVGANPGVSLFTGEQLTAFASVWIVRWSERGSGRAIVVWHDGRVRVLATDRELGYWLSQYFTRNFPEVAGVPWPEPEVRRADVDVTLDLATGLDARARDVRVRMEGVLHRRTFSTDEFDLAGTPHSLSLVLAPMRTARITVGGLALPGEVQLGGTPERPGSSAFMAEAEVWRV
ncbi:hypothetical protein [Phytohabitans houttuyneae]|uniref:Uncharacterized protein n=1 Tax=Phytohabitans houttuyneae TaxID=1076126 RepID=A0A6V8K0H5_9ACTN|nr:hypothetical protein [Phytohabitans houttuyneae]GFJ77154.1 hypothetical protein Phou_013340 [Phytohabitans houttuyneae]